MNDLDIKKIRNELGLTQEKFAELLDVHFRTVQKWESGETKIRKGTEYLIQNLHKTHTKGILDSETEYNKNGIKLQELPNNKWKMTVNTLRSAKATASYIQTLSNGTIFDDFDETTFIIDHYAKGNYMAFFIEGHSMDAGGIDDTPDGALVLGREIGKHLWQDGFHDSKYGFVILAHDGIYHKDITYLNKETGKITCKSRNKSRDVVQEFEISLNEVYQIFHVIKRTF